MNDPSCSVFASETPSRRLPHLSLPLIVAPMFLVSGPDLVIAAARQGLIGAFPTLNAREPETLDQWLTQIISSTESLTSGGFAANLVVSDKYDRWAQDLSLIVKHRVPIVITSIGSPERVTDSIHDYGGVVFADVASIAHARRALAAGVDGLILLCAGAGGNCGWLNPLAFVSAVREFFDGPIAVAGCITSGRLLRAIEVMGANFGYVGTPFIAATESLAEADYREALIEADADDVVLTKAVTGIPSNILLTSLKRHGIDPLSGGGGFHGIVAGEGIRPSAGSNAKPWRDIWTAGHGVTSIKSVESLEVIVTRWQRDYMQSRNA